jgi:crotonobetainyl-CoA:carnitine CoA-transferase CaiB-like acyl-CoA transferase
MSGPLSGIRVLDLSRVLAGPWASQNLADMGAEVIKIEQPGQGDDTRGWGPPFTAPAEGDERGVAAYFLSCNRAKKSVTVDLASVAGQSLIRQLAARSDIVLENFKVGGLAKYGLDYAGLAAVNPQLIYCSITGFGQTGPYANRAGYDFLIQAMGGMMSITGERDDRPGGGPQKAGMAMVDVMTGMYATVAILGALHHRSQGGGGQHIDLALLDVQVAALGHQALNYLVSGEAPRRLGNAHPSIVPYQPFQTRDGHIILAVGNDGQYARFCGVIDRLDLALDADFQTNTARVHNRERLISILEPILATRTTDEWVAALEAHAVPCGPINTLDRVFADPQVQARGLKLDLAHASLGHVPSVRSPIRYSATPLEFEQGPPVLGQHTDEVLRQVLELSDAEIETLRETGVV